MSWAGAWFGFCAVLAVGAGLFAALTPRSRDACNAGAFSLLGVAGACLALDAWFVALLVVLALALIASLALGVAVRTAPPAEPDHRVGARDPVAALAAIAVFLVLALVLTRATWRPAGGPLQLSPEWLGSRVLSDQSLPFVLAGAVLSLASFGVVALLRPRARGR